ncbi:hypothetical protein LTR86_000177 [Recurvomyces mirabilis]|nr:hypothetical protein LTR86_000177 [Recurvomyces mirabilis]
MTQQRPPTSSSPSAKDVQAHSDPTTSAAARETNQSSACPEGPEDAAVAPLGSCGATLISRTRVASGPSTSTPRYHVQSEGEPYEILGVDAIWHNQYLGPDSDWYGIRKQYNTDINAMIMKVTEHMKKGVYTVISMNATTHMLVVIVACEKKQADFPEGMWDEPEGL